MTVDSSSLQTEAKSASTKPESEFDIKKERRQSFREELTVLLEENFYLRLMNE